MKYSMNKPSTIRLSLSTLILASLANLMSPCQGQSIENAPNASVRRGPLALTTVRLALEAMGGSASWEQLHGATMIGTDTDPSINRQGTFEWSDQWLGEPLFRRDNLNSSTGQHSVYIQGAAGNTPPSNSQVDTPNQPHRRPRIDNVAALVVHLPGAALLLALQNPDYEIISGTVRSASAEDSCIRIRRTSIVRADSVKEVAICFSRTTHLPTTAYVVLPNLFRPVRKTIETIRYLGFQRSGHVLVPREVTISQQTQHEKTVTINTVQWNPAFGASTFAGGPK